MSKPPLRIILVGNYPPDGQTSMRAFAHMLRESLQSRGVDVLQTRPEATLGDLIPLRRARKWLGWFDKLAVYPPQLRRDLKRWRKTASDKTNARTIVHICDHSNAFYLPSCAPFPTLITVHDVMAMRAARGEYPGWTVRPSGQRLQRKIGNALSKAEHFASDSGSTREDAHKLLTFSNLKTERVIPIGLNYPYAPLAEDEARGRLAPTMPPPGPFFLAVGSSAWYKNRPVLLRAFARARELRPEMRPLSLVFVGSSLPQELLDLARELDLGESIVEAGARSTESLHAFYALATALVFPSRWEGFGWPPIEAQATGCPVIASNAGPLGENLGDSALTAEPDDVEAFAWHMIQLLEQPETCLKLREAGLKNAQRFSTEAMTEGYLAAYEEILSHA